MKNCVLTDLQHQTADPHNNLWDR